MTAGTKSLILRFGGSLVEQLGAQLYPSATSTIAELISNAWDADARNVWVEFPLDSEWSESSRIIVLDDGVGMSRDEAQAAYLIVGRKKRIFAGLVSAGGRKFHGRKGIGKLAAFGSAELLECLTSNGAESTEFLLDYNKIRALNPDEDYEVEQARLNLERLVIPGTGDAIPHGTRITLGALKLKRRVNGETFLTSMRRRFALNASEMRIEINGEVLGRFDIETQFRFPQDGTPREGIVIDDGWAVETIDGEREVRWWIGFTELPISDAGLTGVSILANEKMAQRPFEFQRSQGAEGQLGLEYLVGEVKADWLDDGTDIDTDLIQSNRDQLQVEDARLDSFFEWGRGLIRWALRKRAELRSERNYQQATEELDLGDLLKDYTKGEQAKFLQIGKKAASLPEMTPGSVKDLLVDLVNAREDKYVRGLMQAIEETDEEAQPRLWALVQEFGLIDARRTKTLVEARIGAIEKLKELLNAGAREVPTLHAIIRADPWLIDPRWALLDDEVDTAMMNVDFQPELDESGNQLDFLFALKPGAPAPTDEVVVVEIKRSRGPDGSIRSASRDEVYKFNTYVTSVAEFYGRSTDRPRITGLMIAERYTPQAQLVRTSLEQITSPKVLFKTWDRVIDDTEKFHKGWLKVTMRRSGEATT